jgi:hypothetical protein
VPNQSAISNDDIIEGAVKALQLRYSTAPSVSAPANWRDIGIDLQFPQHRAVRIRPIDDDGVRVEVFERETRLGDEVVRGYASYEDLAGSIADIIKIGGIA